MNWDWGTAINLYAAWLTAIGRPATTIRLRRHQLDYLGRSLNLPPRSITYDDLIGWFALHDWSPETRRSYRSGVRGFFAWATKQRHIDADPAAEIPQIRVPVAHARPAAEETYRSALANSDARTALMLRLAAEAGLRRAEIAQVHRRDLRPGPQLLVHGKGSRERLVPIIDDLARVISAGVEGYGPSDGWLFPSRLGGHLSPQWVGDVCSAALGPDTTVHQLRHLFATKAYRGTRNLRAVQGLLGHSSVGITERYTACDDSERRLAMLAAIA
jgi:integrase